MASKKLRTKEGLTERERLFVDAYLGKANRVAYKAAQMAGSKAKGMTSLSTVADALLDSPRVQAEIQRRFEQNGLGKDEVISLLADQARVNIMDFVRVDQHTGQPVLDLRRAESEGTGRFIRKFKPIVNRDGKTVTAAIETVDPQKALALIARIQGYILVKIPESQEDDDLPKPASPEAKKAISAYLESIGESGPDEPDPE